VALAASLTRRGTIAKLSQNLTGLPCHSEERSQCGPLSARRAAGDLARRAFRSPAARSAVIAGSLADKNVRLRSGKIESVSRNLAALPKLGVTMQVPEALRAGKRVLQVVDQSGQTPLMTLTPSPDTEQMEMTVPAAPLKVTLKVELATRVTPRTKLLRIKT